MPIRLLIADDHEFVREGLVALLAGTDIDVVGLAASADEAVKLATERRPDVVVLDVRMADHDGLEALDRIRTDVPSVRVIMFSTFDNPTYLARAAALGASDYLLKGATRDELLAAITAVAAGEAPLKAELRRLASGKATDPDSDTSLTPREGQVLRHMALGLSNKEIGRALDIGVDTVKEHVQNILRKIKVGDRTEAAVWAVKRGLV
jgi:DNA-binding NarL/FixJ family response regulator